MSVVEDFARELRAKSSPRFGTWHRVDLHNHTPSSHDYHYRQPDLEDRLVGRIEEHKLAVVMFADHEVLPDAGFIDQLRTRTGALLLRGVELNVFVDAFGKPENKIDKDMFYHMLVGFDPNGEYSPEYWLQEIYRECGKWTGELGGRGAIGIKAGPERLAEVLRPANAIIIPAHLHTTRDPLYSRSVDDIYSDDVFLTHCRNAFTAVEVRNAATARFFDGKHLETGNLHRACVCSSDSHDPDEFGRRSCYAQMENVTYRELKAALELPLRTSLTEPAKPDAYVIGMRIRGQFFPDLWLSFSPYCNMLIAVKGSGKTSVLECLRFALGAEVPGSRAGDVASHLQAILGAGGSVRVLVKRADGALMLVRRNVEDADFHLTFDDDRTVAVRDPNAMHFPTQILGWHEIEQAATDVKVRRLYMDSITSRARISQIEDRMHTLGSQIGEKHTLAAQQYMAWRNLQAQVKRLQDQRHGLQELTDGKMIELRDQYGTASEQRQAIDQMIDSLGRAKVSARGQIQQLVGGQAAERIAKDSPLAQALEVIRATISTLDREVDQTAEAVETALGVALTALCAERAAIEAAFGDFVEYYRSQVEALTPEQQRLLESHREVLEEAKQLPVLQAQQDDARNRVLEMLGQLAGLCEQLAGSLNERTTLRRDAVDSLNRRLESHGVRLSIREQERSPEYKELSARYAAGAQALEGLLGKLPADIHLTHMRLRWAYNGLHESLEADYGGHLFDTTSDLFRFLSIYEDDDLNIEFEPYEDQGYKRIDQLSAGQRCTAVFPIILRVDDGPLIVDQPEDNLDNRHIASAIAPSLQEQKRRRQMIFTSHNANLVVLSDAEAITMFESDGVAGRIEAQGFLACRNSAITKHVIDVLDGGDKALEARALKYGSTSR